MHHCCIYFILITFVKRIQERMKFQRNKDILSALKIIFLMIFVCYAGSVSFFFHSHIINGVTIVHSHPYKADEKGNPTHTHTVSEIQLIRNLSSWYSIGKITVTFTFKALQPYYITETVYRAESIITGFANYFYLLRAPPFILL